MSERTLAFYPVADLHVPHNNREYYLSRELSRRGWDVRWLRPESGTNQGVAVEWPVVTLADLDVRGRTYFFPLYLAAKLRFEGIRTVWVSGWHIRDLRELHWLVRTLKWAGIRVVYDPIDPPYEYERARENFSEEEDQRRRARMRSIYRSCDLIVVVTPELRELLVSHGAPADRTVVGRWGTDADLFDPEKVQCDFKAHLGLDEDCFLVGWLGTMEPHKGLEELILPLIESVAEEVPDIHFVVAGKGTLEDEIRRWAQSRPALPLSVHPTIPYADAPSFTGSLDAYLVATNPDSSYARSICPVKCFDALAMGTRLIVTRTRATEFLSGYACTSLMEFDLDAFRKAVLEAHRAYRAEDSTSGNPFPPVTAHSHQETSVVLADAIERLRAE